MNRNELRLYLWVFAFLFVAPTLQNLTGIFPRKPLYGVEYPVRFPQLDLASWFDGSFQQGFGAWYERVYGLRSILIRTDNHINFALFHRISNRSNLVLGKDDMLYERPYVDGFLRVNPQSERNMEQFASKLRQLQEYLGSRGIAFVFVISPSKVTIYPEYLPDYVMARKNQNHRCNYENLIPFLDQCGVNYLDGHAIIAGLKPTSEYPLFPRGGVHWSYYGAYLFTQKLIAQLENTLACRLNHMDHVKVKLIQRPFGSDADLAEVANLWNKRALVTSSPYPDARRVPIAGATTPNVLFVGGSFVTSILYWLQKFEIVSDRSEFYYYFSNKKIFDDECEIFARDAVILESNEETLDSVGFGFIEAALHESP